MGWVKISVPALLGLVVMAMVATAIVAMVLGLSQGQVQAGADLAPPQFGGSTPHASSTQFQAARDSQGLKVILISIDALRGVDVVQLAKNGTLKNFAKFIQDGIYGWSAPVFPAETSPNHAAMLTGAPTGVHGVIGNSVYLKSPFEGGKTEVGYLGRVLMAETLWEAADRAGMRVVVSNFIHGFVPTWANRLSDRAVMMYLTKQYSSGVPELQRAYVYTKPSFFVTPPQGASYAAVFYLGNTSLTFVVYDQGGKRRAEILSNEKKIGEVSEGQWAIITLDVLYKDTSYKTSFMLKALNLTREGLKLLKGNAIIYNAPVAWFKGPEQLKQKYWDEVVTKNGYIDIYFFGGSLLSQLDFTTISEIINKTVDWYWSTNLFMFDNTNFDLFTGYDVTPDPVEHLVLGLFNPNEPYSDPQIAQWAKRTYVGMLQRIDYYLGQLMKRLGPRDVLMITGDHGQWEIKGNVRINVALRKAGLLYLKSDGSVDLQRSAAYYYGAYVYINPKYKADPAMYNAVVNKVVDTLMSIRDPRNGENVIAAVFARRGDAYEPLAPLSGNELAAVYLDGPAASRIPDVVVAVKAGYCTYDKDATGEDVVLVPSLFGTVGCHDGLGPWKELRAFFGIYAGSAVKLRPLKDIQIFMPQIGSTAAALLGIRLRNATFPPIWVLQ
ncbi:MAG: alkaline phosphatase family protein [Pyrobaculum sp.]